MRSFAGILSFALLFLLVLAVRVTAEASPRGLSDAVPANAGPQPSGWNRKRSVPRGCTVAGFTRCEVGTGRYGWECIDTSTTLDACGSCDNDCSAIPYVGSVSCVRGQCQVLSCRKGFELEYDNGKPICTPSTKQGYMIVEADMKIMN